MSSMDFHRKRKGLLCDYKAFPKKANFCQLGAMSGWTPLREGRGWGHVPCSGGLEELAEQSKLMPTCCHVFKQDLDREPSKVKAPSALSKFVCLVNYFSPVESENSWKFKISLIRMKLVSSWIFFPVVFRISVQYTMSWFRHMFSRNQI